MSHLEMAMISLINQQLYDLSQFFNSWEKITITMIDDRVQACGPDGKVMILLDGRWEAIGQGDNDDGR